MNLLSVKAEMGDAISSGRMGARLFKTFNTTTTNPVRPCVAAGGLTLFKNLPILPNPPAANTLYPMMRRAIDRTHSYLFSCKRGDNGEQVFPCDSNHLSPPIQSQISRFARSPSYNHFLSWDYDDHCSALSTC